VHVAEADGGQRAQREVQRVGLRLELLELVRPADRHGVVEQREEDDPADQRDDQSGQWRVLGAAELMVDLPADEPGDHRDTREAEDQSDHELLLG
jgi:hypothetical protein